MADEPALPPPAGESAPESWVAAGIPASLWRTEFIGMNPTAVLAAVKRAAPVTAYGEAAADWVLEHGTSPQTAFWRATARAEAAGLSEDEVLRLAREAGDRAFGLPLPESADAAVALPPDLPGSPPPPVDEPFTPTPEVSAAAPSIKPYLDPEPPPVAAGPPAAALSPGELRQLAKLAGGQAAAGDLLKLLQGQGAVAGPETSPAGPAAPEATPFTLPLPEVPSAALAEVPVPPAPPFALPSPEPPAAAPGPGGAGGLSPAAAAGPAPGFEPPPAEEPESPGPGGVPWDVLAGLAREAPEGPSRQVPWKTIAALAEGPAAPEDEGGKEAEAPTAQFAPIQPGGARGAALSPFGGLAAEFWGNLLGPPGGGGFGAGGGGESGGGGGSMVALLERIATSLDRLIDIVQAGGANGFPGVNRGGQDFGGWGQPGYDDEDDGYTPSSPSVHLDHLERPGKSRDASARPRKADRRSYHEEEGHP